RAGVGGQAELVAGAEEAGREGGALTGGGGEDRLVVEVLGLAGESVGGAGDTLEDEVEGAALGGEEERALADRGRDEGAGGDDVELGLAVQAVAPADARGQGDHAADGVAAAGVEVAGDVLDAGQDAALEDAGEAGEVEGAGDRVLAEEHLGLI